MLTEPQKALVAFIGRQGRPPEEVGAFTGEASDLQTLIEAGYVVFNGTGNTAESVRAMTARAPESVFSYALTYTGTFEITHP